MGGRQQEMEQKERKDSSVGLKGPLGGPQLVICQEMNVNAED